MLAIQDYQMSEHVGGSWREALEGLSAEDRAGLIQELGISSKNFLRWERGEVIPHYEHVLLLSRLLTPARRLILIEGLAKVQPRYQTMADEARRSFVHNSIPAPFYEVILDACTHACLDLRFRAASLLAMQQITQLLDPLKEGCLVSLFRCTPPSSNGRVCTLYHVGSLGTVECQSPVKEILFVGKRSLIGQSIVQRKPVLFEAEKDGHPIIAWYLKEALVSLIALPLQMTDLGIGGALCVGSTCHAFFTPERIDLLQKYACLLVHAIPQNELYLDVDLQSIPPVTEQRFFLDDLRRTDAPPTDLLPEEMHTRFLRLAERTLLAHSSGFVP